MLVETKENIEQQADEFKTIRFRMRSAFRTAKRPTYYTSVAEDESNITYDFILQKNRESSLNESFECVKSDIYPRINEWLLNN